MIDLIVQVVARFALLQYNSKLCAPFLKDWYVKYSSAWLLSAYHSELRRVSPALTSEVTDKLQHLIQVS